MGIAQDVGRAERADINPSVVNIPAQPSAPTQPPAPARPAALLTRTQPGGGLIYDPRVHPVSDSAVQIRGRREVPGTVPWGFWGGLLVAMVAVFLVTGARNFFYLWDIIWALGALAVGLMLFRYGRRSTLREELLCTLDLERQLIQWPATRAPRRGGKPVADTQPAQDALPAQGELVLSFDEVTEVVFAMIDYPLSAREPEVRVHAFTLLVRDSDERLIPIIEASPDKTETHQISRLLGHQLGRGVSYVGKGFQ